LTGTFRHVGDREIAALHRITVAKATYEAPDGSTFERDVIRDMGYVAAVPLLDDGRTVVLVRQYRGPVDQELLEIPAGLRDVADEPTELTARRELEEEVGRRAGRLELLAHVHQAAGISDEEGWIYLATDLTEVPHDRHGPEEDAMTIETVDLADVPAMVADGRLTDAKTIIGLLLVRDRLAAG
jgi:8-oxo-dGTP pyrophosphatase MutT (NUDIX family)